MNRSEEVSDRYIPQQRPSRRAAVTFDHRDAGTPEQLWATSREVKGARPLDLSDVHRLVVTAAHPDDESLGAGGLLARAVGLGIQVVVLIASAGEASHPASPTHHPEDLARVRSREAQAAVGRLAPASRLDVLDLPDGRLSTVVDVMAREILDRIGDRSQGTLLVAPWHDDNHPDHAAVSAAARRVALRTGCRLVEYPIWAWHWGRPGDGVLSPEQLVAVDLTLRERQQKGDALAIYRSQVAPLSDAPGDEAVVPPGFAEHFRRDREVFVAITFPSAPTGASGRSPSLPWLGGRGRPAEDPSLDRDFFDDFYRAGRDPWGFESRWYEKRKRDITLASLPRRHFASAFEPGCAIGVLTAALADRCDRVLATDISAAPLAVARERLAGRDGVRFEQRRIPAQWPPGRFDLVVLSEVCYYCGADDLGRVIRAAAASLNRDGILLACHWRHPVVEYPISGDEVHRRIREESGLEVLVEHLEEDFRLDVLTPSPALSVARRDGLVR